jgi:hypothetical protein
MNKNGIQYTDEEIKLIRSVLYNWAEVSHRITKNKKRNNDEL